MTARHKHEWKDAPDWVVGPGRVMQECFPCRGLRIVRRKSEPAR